MSSVNGTVFLLPFQFIFLSFSPCLLDVAGTSNTVFNRSVETGILVLFLRGNAVSFSPLSMRRAVADVLYYSVVCSFYTYFVECFYPQWILWKTTYASVSWSWDILFCNLLVWCITPNDLCTLNHPCIPEMNPIWSSCMILLMWSPHSSIQLGLNLNLDII